MVYFIFIICLITDTGEDSKLVHRRKSKASRKYLRSFLNVFACGQVSSPRLYRLWLITYETNYKNKINQTFNWIFLTYWNSDSRSPTIADDVLLSSWICSVPFPENFDRSTGVTWLVEFFLARTSDININIHFIWSKNLSWENWSNADYNLTASERREKKCAQMVSTKPIIIYNKTADKNYK